ncbi:MAG: tetratricopeptide repeat protein [Acidobacteriota bacterium]|nr:tetratricopeptide repeat protein [Acidobacteriota bacterium]
MNQESNQHRIDTLRQEWRSDPTPRRTLQLAEEYGRGGDNETALEVLRSGLEKHPGHVASRVALGRYLLEAGRPGEARTGLEQVALEDQTHLVANKLLVESHLKLGEAREARDRLDLYTLLNESDEDIELFEARLAELETSTGQASEPLGGDAGTAEAISGKPGQDANDGFLAGHSAGPPENIGFGGGAQGFSGASQLPDPIAPETVEEPAPLPALRRMEEPPRDPLSQQPGAADLFQDVWSGIERETYWDSLGSDGIFALEPRASPKEAPMPPPTRVPPEAPEVRHPGAVEPGTVSAKDIEVVESTVTLGRLYLEQGHHTEAGRVFQEVLAREPGNRSALAGLAAAESDSGWTLTAADLVPADVLGRASVIERRRELLTAYLARLKPAAGGV